jgi:hypothetical protein
MQKWEYVEVTVRTMGGFTPEWEAEQLNGEYMYLDAVKKGGGHPPFRRIANELGGQGWEMCGTVVSDGRDRSVVYFRRPLT